MRLIAKVIRISRAKSNCNRLTSVQDVQDYASLIFGTDCSFNCTPRLSDIVLLTHLFI